MRLVIQRVKYASVTIDGQIVGQIGHGLLVLLGVGHSDGMPEIEKLVSKLIQLRIFNDVDQKMNRSVVDVDGGILVVSQFTLYADCKKGNRPSFSESAPPQLANDLYEAFVSHLKSRFLGKVETGRFGAMIEVSLINDGPVTIILDTKDLVKG